MSIKVILFLLFSSITTLCKSQTRLDTINNLTKFSNRYLQALFNKRDVTQVTKFWTDNIFKELKVSYNNGKIAYETNEDLKKLFSKDLQKILEDIKRPITFIQNDKPILLEEDGFRMFLISFDLGTNLNLDKDLLSTSLDFVSDDEGKTWKLDGDHWIQAFMYVLYRRNNR